MQPRFVMRNLPQLQEYLKTVPYGAVKVGLRAFTEYIIGDESHGLKHPDPYKYVSRKSAYGVSFFTEKQRRWFWANGGPDMIGNNRTGQSSNAWEMKETRGGYGYTISNPTTAAYFTRSDTGQARQPAKVGWRTVSKVIASNTAGAIRHAIAEVKKYLASKK